MSANKKPRIFEVVALHVTGKNGKVFDSGDEVTENQFPEGHADLRVEQGFLKEIKPEKESTKK